MLPVVTNLQQLLRPMAWNFEFGAIYFCIAGSENAMGFKVVEVQPTPNPNAAKFILDREVVAQPTSFFNAEQATDHPLAKKLFAIPGVSSLLFLGDFVTVNKRPDVPWKDITKAVETVLAHA